MPKISVAKAKLQNLIVVVLLGTSICQLHAGASFVESYVIISGGSQAGNYYYEVIDRGNNNVRLVDLGDYNLLSGTSLTLRGGQNIVTVTSPDYQKSWNVQSMNYRFYLDGSTVPGFSQMGNFTWASDSYPTYTWTKSDLSVTLANSATSSGTYRFDVSSYGQATYWNGSADTGYYMTDSSTTSATVNVYYGATTTGTQASAFTGSGYFSLNGSGQTYTLNANNTYTGQTRIEAGIVEISGSGNLSSSSAVFIGAGTNPNNAQLTLSGSTASFANNITVNPSSSSGTRTLAKSGTTAQTLSGSFTMDRNVSIDVTGTGGLNISGVMSGANSFTKTGGGTLTLSGSSPNTFSTGTVTISAGTLVLNKTANTAAIAGRPIDIANGATLRTDAAGQIGSAPLVTLTGTAIFDLNGNNQTIALSGGGGTVKLDGSSGSGTLTINNSSSDSAPDTFSGVITDNTRTDGAVTKAGTGTQLLSGANTYDGSTLVSAGALRINNANALGSTTTGTTVSSGAALQLSGGLNNFAAEALSITGTGVNNDGALRNYSGNNTWAGAITLAGASRINSESGTTLTLDVASGNGITGTQNLTFGGAGNVVVADPIATSTGTVTKDGNGALTLSAANTFSGGLTLSAGTLNLNNATAPGTGTFTIAGGAIDNTTAGSLTLSGNVAQNWNGDFSFTGTRDLNLGTGTVSMNANRSVTINGGTLTVGGSVTGNTRNLTKAGTGALVLNGNITTTTGNVTVNANSGTLTLAGVNTFTGGVTLNSGSTLNINSTTALGGGTGAFTIGGGTIDNTSGSAITLANNNAQNWNGDFTFTGTQSLDLGTGAVALGAARQVTVTANNLTVGGVISGGFGITKLGNGTLTLSGSGANTFSGGSIVSAGTLVLNKSANVNAIAGSLTVNSGAIVRTDAANQLNNQLVTVNGTLNLSSQDQSLALAGTSGTASVALGSATMTINNSGTDSFAGIISGTGGLTKTGAGTQTLSGGNTFTGKVRINQGTLSIGAESGLGGTVSSLTADQLQFGGGTLAVTGTGFSMTSNRGITLNSGGGTIDVASGGSLTIQGLITGANTLAKANSGILILSGNSGASFSGATTLTAGTLRLGHDSALGTGGLTLNGGVVASSDNTARTLSNALTIGNDTTFGESTTGTGALSFGGAVGLGSGTRTVTINQGTTFSGAVTSGSLTKAGSAALTLGSDSSSFSTLTINAGSVAINGNTTVTGLAGSGTGAVSIASTKALTVNNSADQSFAQVISGSGGLTKTGSAILNLTGTANTYTGTTAINGGMVTISADASLGGTSAPISLGGGYLGFNGSFTLNSGRAMTITGASSGFDVYGANSVTYNGNIGESGGTARAFDKRGGSGSVLILGGNNSYTGATTVSSGILRATSTTAFGTTAGGVSVTGGAVVELAGASIGAESLTLNSDGISGGGSLRAVSGTSSWGGLITLGSGGRINADSGTSLTLSGGITGGANVLYIGGVGDTSLSGALTGAGASAESVTASLIKDGTGTLTLSAANSNTGDTLVNAGTLRISSGGSANSSRIRLGATSGTSSATLRVDGGVSFGTGDIVVRSGSSGTETITTDAANMATAAVSRNIYMDGDLTVQSQTSGGTLAISGTAFDLKNQTLTVDGAGNVSISSVMSQSTGTGKVTKAGAGTLTLTGASSISGDTLVNAGTLRIGTGGSLNNSTIRLGDTSGTETATLSVAGGVSFGGSALVIRPTGTGVRTITTDAANGTTATLSRNIYLDNGLTLSSQTAGGILAITSTEFDLKNQTLTADGAGDVSISSVLSQSTGSGKVTKTGTGKLTLTGASSYTGLTTVSAGVLNLQHATAAGTTAGGISVTGGAALELQGGITIGAEALTLNGSGVSTGGALRNISGSNTYQGAITLGSASQINSDAGTLTLTGGITGNTFGLTVGGAGDTTINSAIATTSGGLTKTGAGKLTLSGVNTFTGKTTINAGTVSVAAASGLGATPGASMSDWLTLNGGALEVTIGFTGSSNAGITVGSSGGGINVASGQTFTQAGGLAGSGALNKTGDGTLTLTNTAGGYTGKMTISAGVVRANTSLTGASFEVASGGRLGGSGSLGSVTVQSGGRLTPGNSPGILDVSSLTLSGGSGYDWEVDNVSGTAGTNWDMIRVGGGSGTVDVSFTSGTHTIYISGAGTGFSNTGTYSWTIIDAGTLSGYDSSKFAVSYSTLNGVTSPTGTWSFANTGGDLVLSYAPALTSYDITVSSGSTNQAETYTGASALNKLGAGTLVLNNSSNSYSGTTTIKAGTLQITVAAPNLSNGALGNAQSAVIVGDSAAAVAATFDIGAAVQNSRPLTMQAGNGAADRTLSTSIGSGTATQSGAVAVNTASIFSAASGSKLLVSGALTGTGGLTVSGAGVVEITAANTGFSGGTTLSSGSTLRLGNNSALGTGGLTLNGGTLASDGSTARTLANNVTLGGNVTLGDGTGTGDLTLSGTVGLGATRTLTVANTTTLSGVVSGSTFGITKDGSGTLILSGANDYTGATTVNAGVLSLRNATGAGTTAGGISVTSGAALEIQGGITVGAEALTLNGSGISSGGALRNVSGSNTYGGGITLGSASRINSDSGTLTLSGAIGGAGQNLTIGGTGDTTINGAIGTTTGTLTKDGAGNLTLGGNNTYTGLTTITAGKITMASSAASIAGDLSVGASGTFDLNNTTETVGSIAGAGSITLGSSGAGGLTTSSSSSTTFSGVISGAGTFLKDGSGTLTLSGANTMTATTDINAGSILLSGSGSLASSSRINIGTGATLDISGVSGAGTSVKILSEQGVNDGGSVNLGSKTLTMDGGAASTRYQFQNIGQSGNTGGFTLNAANSSTELRLYGTGANVSAYTGTTTLQNGTLIVAGSLASTTINLTGGSLTTEAANGLADTAAITLSSANSTLTIGGSDTIASLAGTAGTVIFNSGTLSVGDANNTTFSGVLQGTSGALVKQGTGTLTLAGSANNTYSGTTTVNNGVLLLQKTAGINAIAGTPTINSGGTIRLGANDQFNGDTTFLTVGSGGTFDLNNFNDTLAVQGAGTITLGSGTLTINPTGTDTFSGAISGTGSVIKANTGTQILSGNNTYSGGTTVSGGVLRIGGGGTTGSVAGDITNNATVTFDRSDAITYGGTMSGTGSLQKWGTGTLTLSGANTVSGANHYFINGTTLFTANQGAGFTGTLNLGDTSGANSSTLAIGTAGVTVSNPINVRTGSTGTMTIAAQNSSGTATFSGNIAANRNVELNAGSSAILALSGNISGFSTIAKRGTGTAVLSGNNSVDLKYDLYAGELQAGAADDLGNNTGNFIGNKLYFDGGTLGATGTFTLGGANGITLGAGGGGIRVAADQTLTLQGYINDGSSTGVTFTKSGAGTLFLDKTDVNDFSGTTLVVSEGTLSTYNPSLLSSTVQLGGSGTTGTYRFQKTDGAVSTGVNFQVNSGGGQIDVGANDLTVSGTVSGTGGLTKIGSGRLNLSGDNSNSGGVTLSAGQLRLSSATAAGTGTITQTSGSSTLEIDTTGTVANAMNFYNMSTLKNVTLTGAKTLNNATYDVASATTTTESGTLSGTGGITKEGAGTLIVSGTTANTFTGSSAVNNGTLQLAKTAGITAISGSTIAVNSGGTLLLGASNQIGNDTALNLAGGTFQASGNSDTIGKLTVSAGSIFDFGNTGGGTTTFTFSDFDVATYAGAVLTINNAAVGSKFVFNVDYTGNNTFSGGANSFASKVQFGTTGQFGQISFGTGTTTLLVAIPDARVYTAAVFLLVLIGVTELKRRRGKKRVEA